MATVVRELHPSVEPPDLTNNQTAQRHFVIFDNATPSLLSTESSVVSLFGNGTLPNFGDPHPRFGGGPALGGGLNAAKAMIAVDYANLRLDPGGNYVWRLTWNYLRTIGSSTTVQPGTPGYWEYSYKASVDVEDAWRDNPGLAFPPNGTPIFPNGSPADVSGTPIDSAGEPGSAFRSQQIVEITEHVAGQYTPATSFAFLKKRNNSTFLGAQAGRLVYAGISASGRLDFNLFSITHSLIWDEWYHMRQQVARGPDGEPYRKNYTGTNLGIPWVAEWVYWVQPFPSLANFNNISVGVWP